MKSDRLTALFEHPRGEMSGGDAAPADASALGREALAAEDVTVIYGSRVRAFALAGMTTSHALDVLGPILGVEPGRPALVNGQRARAGRRLAVNDTLELVRVAGEKG
jgi:hypothetical protein